MKKVFIDSDVILDCFLAREPFYQSSTKILELAYRNKLRAFSSVVVFTNINYFLSQSATIKQVTANLTKLRSIISIITSGNEELDLALNSEFKDFEDAVQYFTALKGKVDCIITRNKKDFKLSKLPVVTPDEFLSNENI